MVMTSLTIVVARITAQAVSRGPVAKATKKCCNDSADRAITWLI